MTEHSIVAHARFCIELEKNVFSDQSEISRLKSLLSDAATNGLADIFEIFTSEDESIIGICIPVEDHPMSILEAGSVLGYCLRVWEDVDTKWQSTWMSMTPIDS